jgi:hypothetical protein
MDHRGGTQAQRLLFRKHTHFLVCHSRPDVVAMLSNAKTGCQYFAFEVAIHRHLKAVVAGRGA